MFDKINVLLIVRDHTRTLTNDATGKYYRPDFVWFLGIPSFATGGLLYFYGNLDSGLSTVVVTVLSVFGALLFNVLMLVYDALGKSIPGQRRMRFLRQLASNISFAILIALATIVSVLIGFVVAGSAFAEATFHGFTYSLVTMFLLTLAMILKRTHILLATEE